MDLKTLIVNLLIGVLANFVSWSCKLLLKPRNRQRVKAKFRLIYHFSIEQTKRAQYCALEFSLFSLPSYMRYISKKFIQLAKYLSFQIELLKSLIQVLIQGYRSNYITNDLRISNPQHSCVKNGWKHSIIQKVIESGCISATELAQQIGPGIRALDLKPELDSLIGKGILECRESGEPGCWHGFQIYELAT